MHLVRFERTTSSLRGSSSIPGFLQYPLRRLEETNKELMKSAGIDLVTSSMRQGKDVEGNRTLLTVCTRRDSNARPFPEGSEDLFPQNIPCGDFEDKEQIRRMPELNL